MYQGHTASLFFWQNAKLLLCCTQNGGEIGWLGGDGGGGGGGAAEPMLITASWKVNFSPGRTTAAMLEAAAGVRPAQRCGSCRFILTTFSRASATTMALVLLRQCPSLV